jgi:hypothetical protein
MVSFAFSLAVPMPYFHHTFISYYILRSIPHVIIFFCVSYLCNSDPTGAISDRSTKFNRNIFQRSTNAYFNKLLLPGTIHHMWCNGVCCFKEKSIYFNKNGCYKIIWIYYIIRNINIFLQYTTWISLHMFILIAKNAIISWIYIMGTVTIYWTI